MADIDDEAAAWAVRHPLSASDQRRFDTWLSQDQRHSGAFLRMMAALSVVDEALALPPIDRFGADSHLCTGSNRPLSRRAMAFGLGGAVAASMLGTIGWAISGGERMQTMAGEIRRMPLSDGSIAMIDTDSDLNVRFADDDRRVTLAQGRVWFQVAKDRHRPFVVDAGAARATAIGTAFSVERAENGVQISVTEGVVAARAPGKAAKVTYLTAGEFAFYTDGGNLEKTGRSPQAIERALAWRDGEIALEGDTLASAAAQFNRYNARKIIIADPVLERERLVGLFQIDSPATFAESLAATLPVDVVEDRNAIIIKKSSRSVTESSSPSL